MTQVNIDYATPGKSPLPGRVVAIIVASLCISIITLLIALMLTSTFRRSWQVTRDQIISAPAIDKNNAIIAARMAARAGQIRSAAAARAKLPKARPLTTDETAHVVSVVQSQLQAKMSPAQIQALTNELQKPGQQLVDPALPISTSRSVLRGQPPFQVVLADTGGMGPGQSIRFETLRSYISKDDREGVSMYIDLKGTLSRVFVTSADDRASMAQHGTVAPLASSLIPQWQIEERRDLGFAMAAATEFVVAAVLLIAAINALRGKQRWPFYHRLYAWAQLALLIATALIWFATKPSDAAEASFLVVLFIVAATYPIVLIFIMPRNSSVGRSS